MEKYAELGEKWCGLFYEPVRPKSWPNLGPAQINLDTLPRIV